MRAEGREERRRAFPHPKSKGDSEKNGKALIGKFE
jgi:hypothetical protein